MEVATTLTRSGNKYRVIPQTIRQNKYTDKLANICQLQDYIPDYQQYFVAEASPAYSLIYYEYQISCGNSK